MTQFLRYAARSDVGMVRKDNEDSGYAGRTLLAVADGMGGHAAGELASSTAVATVAELDSEELPAGDVLTALDDAMLTSAERISQFIAADPARAGMGTTLTAVLWRGGRIALIHVGDSRAYLLRGGELSQITHDHTYVQTLIDAGRITPDEARVHPKRNLLLRAIDGTGAPQGETSIREARVGDRYLLCSDGLSGVLPDRVLEQVLSEVADPTAAVTELVDLALAAGAPDNVTAVVADVVEVADAQDELESALGGPVVVGAAGDQRNRAALPGLMFPDDVGPGGAGVDVTGSAAGPVVAGGLVTRDQVRARSLDVAGVEEASAGPATDDGQSPADSGVAPDAPPASVDAATAGLELAADGSAAGELPRSDADAAAEVGGSPGWAWRHWRVLGLLGGVLLGTAFGVLGFVWWLSSQWFVGSYSGYVAVFQGIPQQIAGVPLSRVTTRTAVSVSELPYYDQAQLYGTIDATTELEALRIVSDLEVKAAACSSAEAPLGCPVTVADVLGPAAGGVGSDASTSPKASAGVSP